MERRQERTEVQKDKKEANKKTNISRATFLSAENRNFLSLRQLRMNDFRKSILQ